MAHSSASTQHVSIKTKGRDSPAYVYNSGTETTTIVSGGNDYGTYVNNYCEDADGTVTYSSYARSGDPQDGTQYTRHYQGRIRELKEPGDFNHDDRKEQQQSSTCDSHLSTGYSSGQAHIADTRPPISDSTGEYGRQQGQDQAADLQLPQPHWYDGENWSRLSIEQRLLLHGLHSFQQQMPEPKMGKRERLRKLFRRVAGG